MTSGSIVWGFVGGFLAGVTFGSVVNVGYMTALWFVVCAVVFLTIAPKRSLGVAMCAVSVGLGCGIVRVHAAWPAGDVRIAQHVGERVEMRGVVIAEPDARDASTRLVVDSDLFGVASSTFAVRQRFLVVAPAHTTVQYGDAVRVSGVVKLPKSFVGNNGRTFDYVDYLAKDGIAYEMSPAQVEYSASGKGNMLLSGALAVKRWFVGGLHAVLPEPEAGLAAGITVGDKRSVGPALSQDFQTVSLTHVLVLSGYNITIVIAFLMRFLLRTPRWVRFGICGVVVLFFVGITGGQASAARAGIMVLVGLVAAINYRTYDVLRALGFAAFLLIFWKPLSLVFDPGFQLSVLATLGLVLLSPRFERMLTRIPQAWGMRELCASTLGAQVAVLPLIVYQTGVFSVVGLPVNVLVLAIVPVAMVAASIAAVGGALCGHAALLIGLPAYGLLWSMVTFVHLCASLPFAAIHSKVFSLWWAIGAYALIGVGSIYLPKALSDKNPA